jgi:hypothetical protein
LVIAQPGVFTIGLIEPISGLGVWTRLVPDLEKIVLANEQVILVQTGRGFSAFDYASGELRWEHDAPDLLFGQLVSDTTLVYSCRKPVDAGSRRSCPQVVWLDLASGMVIGETSLSTLEGDDPRMGPLVAAGQRLWVFFGSGHDDANRDLIELVPKETPRPVGRTSHGVWLQHIPKSLREAAAQILGDWQVWSSVPGKDDKPLVEMHGEPNVVAMDARHDLPVVFGRHVDFRDAKQPRLIIRVGDNPGPTWELAVALGNETIWSQTISSETHPQRYNDFQVDLSALAGKSGWLTVTARHLHGGDRVNSFWKRLELID